MKLRFSLLYIFCIFIVLLVSGCMGGSSLDDISKDKAIVLSEDSSKKIENNFKITYKVNNAEMDYEFFHLKKDNIEKIKVLNEEGSFYKIDESIFSCSFTGCKENEDFFGITFDLIDLKKLNHNSKEVDNKVFCQDRKIISNHNKDREKIINATICLNSDGGSIENINVNVFEKVRESKSKYSINFVEQQKLFDEDLFLEERYEETSFVISDLQCNKDRLIFNAFSFKNNSDLKVYAITKSGMSDLYETDEMKPLKKNTYNVNLQEALTENTQLGFCIGNQCIKDYCYSVGEQNIIK